MTEPLPVHGVDISHHQDGPLDMVGAKTRGLMWLYHKATEGNSFRDDNYAMRRKQAAAADLPFGGYHFARADVSGGATQADAFLIAADPQPGDLRPALDLETSEGLSLASLRTWASNFVARIERAVGVKPLIYSPFDLGSAIDGCVIWRPRYNNTNTPPVLPFDIWQFSNGVLGVPNVCEGIGHVDLNTMRKGLTMADIIIPQEDNMALTNADAALVVKALLTAQIPYDPDNPDSVTGNLARHLQSIRDIDKDIRTLIRQLQDGEVQITKDAVVVALKELAAKVAS